MAVWVKNNRGRAWSTHNHITTVRPNPKTLPHKRSSGMVPLSEMELGSACYARHGPVAHLFGKKWIQEAHLFSKKK